MRHLTLGGTGAVCMAALVAACQSGSGGASPSVSGGATVAAAPVEVQPCRAGDLVLRYGPPVVAMTGEHAVLYQIRNRGRVACSLTGYPHVALYSAGGRALVFTYTEGHSMYVTKATPKAVVVAPARPAYVLVAKYRCDIGDLASAATIRLTLPGRAPIILVGPATAPGLTGVAALDYCEGGPNDPGQTVGVSPIEATPNAAGPFAG